MKKGDIGNVSRTHLLLVPKSKNAWSYTFTPLLVFMACCLVKHKDNFTFTFTRKCESIWLDWSTAGKETTWQTQA
jgi:hypothetical protein